MTTRTTTYGLVLGLIFMASASAQAQQGGYGAAGAGPQGNVAFAYAPMPYSMEGPYVDAHGEPINQACYQCGDACGAGGCMGGSCNGCGGTGCGACRGGLLGGGGYDACGGGLLGKLCGNMRGEQCGPHWFDFSAEYLYYTRDDDFLSDSIVVSTFGIANDTNVINGTIPANQIALTTGDLADDDDSHGYRLTGRLDVGALSFVEFAYSGIYSDDNAASVTSRGTAVTDQLFSIYSLYGAATNGNFGIPGSAGAPTGADFAETDNAQLHSISYDSELHTVEASFRRYWVGYNPRVSGTMLVGFRFTSLEEQMGFFSQSAAGTLSLAGESDNRLYGVQTGGDAWFCVFPGFRVGAEAKAGVYDNNYTMTSSIAGVQTSTSGDQAAFLGEAKVSAVANVTPCLSVKVGYELLYMNELAQLGDSVFAAMPYGDINNISANPPGGGIGASAPSTTDGEALYHGAHAGIEYVW